MAMTTSSFVIIGKEGMSDVFYVGHLDEGVENDVDDFSFIGGRDSIQETS